MAIKRMDNVGIVVNDLKAAIAFFGELGMELVGEIVQYKDIYLLCYLRGPEGIMLALAEEIGT